MAAESFRSTKASRTWPTVFRSAVGMDRLASQRPFRAAPRIGSMSLAPPWLIPIPTILFSVSQKSHFTSSSTDSSIMRLPAQIAKNVMYEIVHKLLAMQCF
jgi:hypothetical protein